MRMTGKLSLLIFYSVLLLGGSRTTAQNIDSLKGVLSRSNDPLVQAELNLEIGGALLDRNDSSAVDYLRRAVMLGSQERDPVIEMRAHHLLYRHLKNVGRFDDAIMEMDNAITQARVFKDRKAEKQYLYTKARSLRKNGQAQRSIEPYKSALDLMKELEDSLYLAKTYNELGISYKNLALYDSAKTYYKLCLVTSQAINDSSRYANALNNLGNVVKNQGFLDTALHYYFQALEMHRALKDTFMLTNVLNNIGVVNGKIGANDLALEYYHECLRLRNLVHDTFKAVSVLSNIAEVFEVTDRMDSAYYYANLAIKLGTRRGTKSSAASAHEALGDYKYNEGRYDSARWHFQQARMLREEIDEKLEMVSNIYDLGKVDMAQGYLNKADSAFQLVLEMSTEMGTLFQMSNAAQRLGEVAFKQGRFEEAYQYQVRHTFLLDSLNAAKQVGELSKEMAKYESEKKQREIELLNKENEFQALRIDREKTLRRLLVVVVLLVLILVFVLWNRARSLRTVNATLEEQKSTLEKNDHEKKVLLKEIHHRVKNNLQIISSLLSMHAREMKDERVSDALKEGKNRVKSMALIHQMFYQDTEGLTEIGLHTYAKELCQSILSSYAVNKEDIALDFNLDKVTINIDDGILLGLIINELVSNSVKYGFPNGRKGTITIQLKQSGDELHVVVSDDGVGKNHIHGPESTSFGLKLVNSFIKKLKGSISVDTTVGYRTTIIIPHKEEGNVTT